MCLAPLTTASGTKEGGVELAVVFEEDSQVVRDGAVNSTSLGLTFPLLKGRFQPLKFLL
jgi:hypothetical protein